MPVQRCWVPERRCWVPERRCWAPELRLRATGQHLRAIGQSCWGPGQHCRAPEQLGWWMCQGWGWQMFLQRLLQGCGMSLRGGQLLRWGLSEGLSLGCRIRGARFRSSDVLQTRS